MGVEPHLEVGSEDQEQAGDRQEAESQGRHHTHSDRNSQAAANIININNSQIALNITVLTA